MHSSRANFKLTTVLGQQHLIPILATKMWYGELFFWVWRNEHWTEKATRKTIPTIVFLQSFGRESKIEIRKQWNILITQAKRQFSRANFMFTEFPPCSFNSFFLFQKRLLSIIVRRSSLTDYATISIVFSQNCRFLKDAKYFDCFAIIIFHTISFWTWKNLMQRS